MKRRIFFLILSMTLFGQCNDTTTTSCSHISTSQITKRSFAMGFSTWPFGNETSDVDQTYQFVTSNGDIYGEQIDDNIPWSSWMDGTPLPVEYANRIDQRAGRKPTNAELLLQVSFLNDSRTDIMEDIDGAAPPHTTLNDPEIENAYFEHLDYLVKKFSPKYIVLGMEVNELRKASEQRWSEYKLLMGNIRVRLRSKYPELKMSESVTLHQWYNPDVANPEAYIQDIADYVNELDYAAISFYPFLRGLSTEGAFQDAFDFLHSHVTIPIAVSETGHIAENLDIDAYNTHLNGSECEQDQYLRVLFNNADSRNYEFVVWFTFRDFDKLWNSLPVETKELAKIWRDTGLLDGAGRERKAFNTWSMVLDR